MLGDDLATYGVVFHVGSLPCVFSRCTFSRISLLSHAQKRYYYYGREIEVGIGPADWALELQVVVRILLFCLPLTNPKLHSLIWFTKSFSRQ